MSLENIDKAYVECCKVHLKDWIEKCAANQYQFQDEALDEMIEYGGEGLCTLQRTFTKIIDSARAEGVEEIDVEFVNRVLNNS